MDINLSAALGMVGIPEIRVLPATTQCPICNVHSLEVSGQNRIVCRSCWFIGDVVQLIARTRKYDVGKCLADLRTSGICQCEKSEEVAYLSKLLEQAPFIGYHTASQQWFKEMPSSLRVAIQHYGGQTQDSEIRRLLPHVTLIRPDVLKELLSKEGKKALQQVGNYTGIGLAVWTDARLTGYWVCTVQNQVYVPLTTDAGVGGAFTVGAQTQSAIITDDPTTALSLLIRSVKSTITPAGVLLPVGEIMRWTPARERIYWSSGNRLRWLRLAMRDLGAKAVLHNDVKYEWDKVHYGTIARFQHHLSEHASPPSEAIGRLLLTLQVQNSRALLADSPLTVPEQSEVVSRFSGSEQDDLRAIFESGNSERAIEWCGKLVVEAAHGWTCGSTLISDAILRLEQIRVTDKPEDAMVSGTVTYQRHTFRFEEPLAKMRKNAGSWLHSFVLRNAGASCIIGTGWGRQLFDIAQQFHRPASCMPGDQAGWDGGSLKLPCFEINNSGIQPITQHIAGPMIPIPVQPSSAELASLQNVSNCQIYLACLGNILAQVHKVTPRKIAVTGAAVAMTRLENVFKRRIYTDETAENLLDMGQHPIPVLATASTHTLAGIVDGRPANIITTVDRHSFALLSTKSDWLQIQLADSTISGFESIFFVVAAAIDAPVVAATRYRDLAKLSAQTLSKFGLRNHRLDAAARELDTLTQRGLADQVLHLIRYGVNNEIIKPDVLDDGVRVKQSQFRSATASGVVRMPPMGDMTDALLAARYLTASSKGEWVISPEVWGLYESLVPV